MKSNNSGQLQLDFKDCKTLYKLSSTIQMSVATAGMLQTIGSRYKKQYVKYKWRYSIKSSLWSSWKRSKSKRCTKMA